MSMRKRELIVLSQCLTDTISIPKLFIEELQSPMKAMVLNVLVKACLKTKNHDASFKYGTYKKMQKETGIHHKTLRDVVDQLWGDHQLISLLERGIFSQERTNMIHVAIDWDVLTQRMGLDRDDIDELDD